MKQPPKLPPPIPKEKKAVSSERLVEMNPIIFPQKERMPRIHPKEFLDGKKAFLYAEILKKVW